LTHAEPLHADPAGQSPSTEQFIVKYPFGYMPPPRTQYPIPGGNRARSRTPASVGTAFATGPLTGVPICGASQPSDGVHGSPTRLDATPTDELSWVRTSWATDALGVPGSSCARVLHPVAPTENAKHKGTMLVGQFILDLIRRS
jgi:hypothetical protein